MPPEFLNTILFTPSRITSRFTFLVKTYFIWRKIRKLSSLIEKNLPRLRTTRKLANSFKWSVHSNDRVKQWKPEVDGRLLGAPNIWSVGRSYIQIEVMIRGNGPYSPDLPSSESKKPYTRITIRASTFCIFSHRFGHYSLWLRDLPVRECSLMATSASLVGAWLRTMAHPMGYEIWVRKGTYQGISFTEARDNECSLREWRGVDRFESIYT